MAEESGKRSGGCLQTVAALIVVVGVLAYCAPKTATEPQTTRYWLENEPTVQAEEVLQQFQTNEVAAEARFKDKVIQIAGTVQMVDAGIGDSANVFVGPAVSRSVTLGMAENQSGAIAKLAAGKEGVFQCTSVQEVLGTVVGLKCLVKP